MVARILKSFTPRIMGSFRHGTAHNRGFALVATVSMLVLLTVIALGLLTLSSVNLRSSTAAAAQANARANARMAMMLAIGQLQQDAGPDTRVTAPADILNGDSTSSTDQLALTGVWKSWEGSDHTASGAAAARPIAPDYASKRVSTSSSNGRFVSWLVSKPPNVYDDSLISNDPNWKLSDAFKNLVSNTPFDGSIPLLSSGSLKADDPRQVHVAPVLIDKEGSQQGAYAWWVSGENQKARLPVPYKPANNDDAAAWSVQVKSHAVADPSALELDVLLAADGPAQAAKAMTLKTCSLLVPNVPNTPDPAKQFHDLSAVSVGLLTNTATGGWRKDLSLFTENWDLLPDTGAEVFQIAPYISSSMTKPKRIVSALASTTAANYAEMLPAGSVFYPWSRHRPSPQQMRARSWTAAVTSWHHLKDFATLYKKIDLQGGKPTIPSKMTFSRYTGNAGQFNWTGLTYGEAFFDYHHTTRVMPVLGRTHIIYYLEAVPAPAPDTGKFNVRVGIDPLVTLWNPYNITLKTTPQWVQYPRSLPPAFQFNIGGQATNYHYLEYGTGQAVFDNTTFTGRAGWVRKRNGSIGFSMHRNPANRADKLYSELMAPGITKVFSWNTVNYAPTNVVGYSPVGSAIPTQIKTIAHQYTIMRRDPTLGTDVDLVCEAGDSIRIDARFDAGIINQNAGIYSDFGVEEGGTPQCMATKYRIGYDFAMANTLWPPIAQGDFPSYTVGQLYDGTKVTPKPFMSMMFGPRLATDTNVPVKGFLQSDMLQNSISMGNWAFTAGGGVQEGQRLYGSTRGIMNPVNAAFDCSFVPHTSGIDSRLPNVSQDGQNRGYIMTGVQSGDGLSRIATAELPLRPLASLAELQHWSLRVDNPVPPYQSYIIANSDAQPLFAPNEIVGSNAIDPANVNVPNNLQHDDSYCANHILFDDWFFSTIAPQPTTFGPTGKTLQQTFTDFVRTGAPLDNHAYRPILEDRGISAAQTTQLFNNEVNTAESYRTIASRLEVDGMFNVNSTSVKAWRALLGHARNQRIPCYDNNGNMVLSAESAPAAEAVFPVSRTTVASDVAAGKNGSSGSFPGASEYSGYRVFTDAMLDQMAEEMVRQVRLRGPFLSLSEFVNRQLSNNPSDNQLALAGAVQSALNVLATNTNASANPYKVLQDNSLPAGQSVLVTQNKQAGSDFTYFPEASEGKSVYGLPGWPRQADILRPLAPILTARDDTFTIRAYGDARDANGKIIARVTCEALVRRTRDFVSNENEPDSISGLSATNEIFGRRFQLISFRWLNANEI